MSIDPFRIQILTLGLDSRMVLSLAGLVIAGFVFRASARRSGVEAGLGIWWDLVVAALVGARLVWIALHAGYFLRSPQEVFAITDGGLDPIGVLIGSGYALWKLHRHMDQPAWVAVLTGVATSAVVVLLFDRAGCALTTCGSGPISDVAWAMQRGGELRQPLALYQAGILALALVLVSALRLPAATLLGIAVAAAVLSGVIGLVVGGDSGFEALLALGLAKLLGALAIRGSRRPFTSGAIIP